MDPIEQAGLAVVVEIFRRHPGVFVWIAGRGPRTRYDIDLTPRAKAPDAGQLADAVEAALDSAGPELNREFHVVRPAQTGPGGFVRIRVEEGGRAAFSVDVTRIPGSIRATQATLVSAINGSASVDAPAHSSLLYLKARAIYSRRYPKPGDLFDLWFLLGKDASLDEQDRAALEDEFAPGAFDADTVAERLEPFRTKRFVQALARSGVDGITEATAASMIDRVAHWLEGLAR